MRSFAHLTPRYVKDRVLEMIYHYRQPADPWLTRVANSALSGLLLKGDVGLEFGAGRSTLWIARRVKQLTSIEHNKIWFDRVKTMLAAEKIENVKLELANGKDPDADNYLFALKSFRDHELDFVLVDGAHRGDCAIKSIPKLRCGGIMIIDNVNWYLPSTSRSPNSRSLEQGAVDLTWAQVQELVSGWRVVWTSSGVTDTAIFFKPCASS